MTTTYYYNGRGATQKVNPRWWAEKDPGKRADAIVGAAKLIAERQRSRRRLANLYAQLYSNQTLSSVYHLGTAKQQAQTYTDPYGMGTRLTLNVVQSCIDTAASKIAKNRTRVRFLTTAGNWAQQKRSKLLTRFGDGLFDAGGVYPAGQRMFTDGCIFEGGVLEVFTEPDGSIKVERVVPIELLVDDAEAIYGNPRTMFRQLVADRDVVIERFCDRKTVAGRDNAKRLADEAGYDPITGSASADSNLIMVTKAWHLPSLRDSADGVHAIAIQGATLHSEQWSQPRFPFVKFSWNDRLTGWWGQPLAEQLLPIQLELNNMVEKARIALRHMAVPRWLLPVGSGVDEDSINNDPRGSFLYYNADKPPPQPFVAQALPREFYERMYRLKEEAYEISGVSQLAASSVKPAGLNAAVAIEEFRDIETERFVIPGQRFEQAHVDLMGLMVNAARDMYKAGVKIRVRAPGTKLLEEIDWKNIDLDEDQYVIQRFPSSLLPNSVAGRLQRVEDLMAGGWIDKEEGLRLLDAPDLEPVVSIKLASLDAIRRQIDLILEDGEYASPEPYIESARALRMAQGAFLKAQSQGCPEDRLDLLDRWVQELDERVQSQAAPAMAADPAAQQAQVAQQAQMQAQITGDPRQQMMGGTPALPSMTPAL